MNEPNFKTEDNNIRFIVESAMAKQEKANLRLWIICLVLIVALLGTNICWICYENQFEDVVTTTQQIEQETSGDGGNYIGTFVGGDYNGEIKTDSNNNDN